MPSRSFRRVLGETNLERKCRFLFGSCLVVLITCSFWWYGNQTDRLVREQNRRYGRALVDSVLMARHWQEWELQEEDKNPKVKSVDDMRRLLIEALQSEEYQSRFILPENENGIWEPHAPHEWEKLGEWQKEGLEVTSDDEIPYEYYDRDDGTQYQYYEAVFAKERCVDCHRVVGQVPNPDLQTGDLMALVQIRFSAEAMAADRAFNRGLLLATAIITVFLAMIALYVIVRYVIVKPLTHLRDVTDEISRGNLRARARIKTGDEFEKLGQAFNRMLRHMVDAQEELRGVNADLDAKVDQLAQANMRLYEMNRVKSDFLATVSHELRTPLNSIIGFSDVLSSIDTLDEKQQRYAGNIQRSGRMLLDMINDILDLAKIESGRMNVSLSEFPIESAITAQCDMARPLTEKKNIDLEYEIEAHLPRLYQDQAKVQQILNNLLSNAIKFTPEGGRINISARREGQGRLELIVADTGVGIAEHEQQAVFEKFRQSATVFSSGDAMTREFAGTGLGLSIVKEICRLLGGEVSLQSELGKGSTFTVHLPWRRAEQPRLESSLNEDLDELTKPRRLELPPPSETTVTT